jgi:K+-transporting ATPase KdpF subunit
MSRRDASLCISFGILPKHAIACEEIAMDYLIAVPVSVALFIYLLYALVKPERF